ncbi:hypothetical protein [Methylobacterium sp. P5_C11]
MWPPQAHAAERRAEALRLLRDTRLTVDEIGARLDIGPKTIRTWNARAGWVRPRQHAPRLAMARWTAGRRASLARLLATPGNDPGDVSEALGFGRPTAALLSLTLGVDLPNAPLRRAGRGIATDPAIDPAILRGHLSAHVVRQIAAFDAALGGGDPPLRDSARVLRDLGGLKRLLDTLAADTPRGTTGEGGDGGTGPDLPALRAEIARRYAGFVGGRATA